MKRLRRLSLSMTMRRKMAQQEDHDHRDKLQHEHAAGPEFLDACASEMMPSTQIYSTSDEVIEQAKRPIILRNSSMTDSAHSCGDTTTEGTNTTRSHSDDDDDSDQDDNASEKAMKPKSELSLIESIQQLDALLSSKSSQKSRQNKDVKQADDSRRNDDDVTFYTQLTRRAKSSGEKMAFDEEPNHAASRMQRMTRRMSGGGRMLRRMSGSESVSKSKPQNESTNAAITETCYAADASTTKSRISPARILYKTMRQKSFRALRRRSVSRQPPTTQAGSKVDLNVVADVNLLAEHGTEEIPAHGEFTCSDIEFVQSEHDDSSHPFPKGSQSHDQASTTDQASLLADQNKQASDTDDLLSSSHDSESHSDAQSDEGHYNSDDDVYNTRRQATSPKQKLKPKLAAAYERLSLMNVLPRPGSPVGRTRSVSSLPTPRNELEVDDESDYDNDTISTVSEASDTSKYIIEFDDLEAINNQQSVSLFHNGTPTSTSRRQRRTSRPPLHLNNSFCTDVSSEVDDSLIDSVVGRHQSTGVQARRVTARRSSIGTATSISSELDDSIVDSLADHQPPPRRVRRPSAAPAKCATGWEPTFVSPIKENRRRRLSLNNIPNALNDGSRGLPKFDSHGLMLSEQSEDTFTVEQDDSSEA
ncbi:hypothetical protein MPSEU_000743100 [Mayamaea pseudoterrestris]|nr:hypothetical protein MPSEU_000743100 [Mayamaea pseudoterrestris]